MVYFQSKCWLVKIQEILIVLVKAQGSLLEKFLLKKAGNFVLFRPSTEQISTISITEGILIYSKFTYLNVQSVQFSSITQSCPTLCNPMNCSTPGPSVHHQLLELTQTHVHQVDDAIQQSHPLLSLSSPTPNPSEHQGLFQSVNSSHEVAKVLEFQLQNQSFQ